MVVTLTTQLCATPAVASITFILFVLLSDPVNSLSSPQRDSRQEEQSCHLRELDLCLASVAVFTQNTNAHQVNNAEVNRQCKILLETETCLHNYTSRCMTDMQSQLVNMIADGGLGTIRELCKPQSKIRSTYLKHGDCINNQYKAQRVCMRDFQVSLEKAVDINWQDRLKLGCCAFNKLNACVRDVVEPKCGAEAYELHSQFFRATFSRLPSVTCARYEHGEKLCASLLPPAGSVPKGAKSHSVLSKLFSSYTGT